MTNQEKIAYLRQYRVNELAIERTQEELEKWRSRAEKCTAGVGASHSGCGGNSMQESVEHILKWEDLLHKQVEKDISTRKTIETAISHVSDKRMRLLLQYRYIDGMTWEQIAARMHLSTPWIWRMHGNALNEISLPKINKKICRS